MQYLATWNQLLNTVPNGNLCNQAAALFAWMLKLLEHFSS